MDTPISLEEWSEKYFDKELVKAKLIYEYVYPDNLADNDDAVQQICRSQYAYYLDQFWRNRPYTPQ